MKNKVNEHLVGLSFGTMVGGLHAAWSLLIMAGSAQAFLDWIYDIHFLNNPFIVSGFDATKALTLVAVTFVVGYGMGWIVARIWNMFAKKH